MERRTRCSETSVNFDLKLQNQSVIPSINHIICLNVDQSPPSLLPFPENALNPEGAPEAGLGAGGSYEPSPGAGNELEGSVAAGPGAGAT